eukprot:CAMPEP_0185037148 /NCGR_PEP_ID=MMETSP1103-20130426/31126_1 /TAXON_ID=36769 /ORGANISM="Paraphysomonas bandaiensis, Strain Caron Lab Isolate" /LENGTH=620 /DNA_ID=CAMNT_0027574981 /DNA_START=89 /DNA_END=1948 /DNA_ORIENTATION=-
MLYSPYILSVYLLWNRFTHTYAEDIPTVAPTTSYHHENEVMFEILSIVALSLMLLILILAFCGDCYMKRKKKLGVLEPREFGHESTRVSKNLHSIELGKSKSTDTPLMLLDKVKIALTVHRKVCGDIPIPSYWRVPAKEPWPSHIWGFELGKVINNMCGTSSVVASTPIADRKEPKTSSTSKSETEDDEEEEHRHETWYELFYDLVFVASALQLGMVIKYDHRLLGLVKAAILFLMLRSTWDHLTMYQNRFHINDVTHMAYYLLQAMGAFVIALHLRVEDDIHHEYQHSWDRDKHQHPISLMATMCRILTIAMYIRAAFNNTSHRPYLIRIILHTSASAVVFALSMLTPTNDSGRAYLYVWAVGILVERPLMHFLAVLRPDDSPPLIIEKHVGHLVSRQGTFFMLILGEAVIQLVQAHGGYDFPSYVRALLGFAVVFNVGNVYYEQQQREPKRHVLVRSTSLGYLWIDLQSILSMCVLFFAVGVKVVFHSFDEYQEMRDEFLMCGFASISLIMMYSMSLMHRGFEFNFNGTIRRLVYHVFFYTVALATAIIPLFATSTTLSIVFLHILTSALVVQDVFSRALRIHELSSVVSLSEKEASKAWASAMDTSIKSDIYNYGMD